MAAAQAMVIAVRNRGAFTAAGKAVMAGSIRNTHWNKKAAIVPLKG